MATSIHIPLQESRGGIFHPLVTCQLREDISGLQNVLLQDVEKEVTSMNTGFEIRS